MKIINLKLERLNSFSLCFRIHMLIVSYLAFFQSTAARNGDFTKKLMPALDNF
jgi:hypothetical protein